MRERVEIPALDGSQQDIGNGVGVDPPQPATLLQCFKIAVHEGAPRQLIRAVALARAELRTYRPWTQDGQPDLGPVSLELERE